MAPMTESSPDEMVRWIAARLSAAAPGARVFLFGSHAREEAGPQSDVDLLVIEPVVPAPRAESARLRRELRALNVSIDLLVVSEDYAMKWAELEGDLIHIAMHEGKEIVPA